jgi:hypothetical protein
MVNYPTEYYLKRCGSNNNNNNINAYCSALLLARSGYGIILRERIVSVHQLFIDGIKKN